MVELVGGLGEEFDGLPGGQVDLSGSGGIGVDLFEERGGFFVLQQAQGDQSDDADFGICIAGGGADGG